MSEADRPPLDPITYEQIRELLYKVDQRLWPMIADFRVPRFIPLSTPVPPQRPLQLIRNLQSYASMLFKTEADQYEQFRDDGRYPAWLRGLGERVLARVLEAFERIEQGDANFTLSYHGIAHPTMISELRKILGDLVYLYTWKDSAERTPAESFAPNPTLAVGKEEASDNGEPIAAQIKRLQAECDITAADMAEALEVDERSIYRHLAGKAKPRRKQIKAYEKLFSKLLQRSVTLRTSAKRHRNVR
jgi:DNA-binding XRE family transcriptional regulator